MIRVCFSLFYSYFISFEFCFICLFNFSFIHLFWGGGGGGGGEGGSSHLEITIVACQTIDSRSLRGKNWVYARNMLSTQIFVAIEHCYMHV